MRSLSYCYYRNADETISEIIGVSEEIVDNEFDDDDEDIDPTILPDRILSTDAEDEDEDEDV